MPMSSAAAAAIVLAAGRGSRFGGGKLLARLEGKPLLQHVLDTAAASDLKPVIVVLGHQARRLEQAISWRAERRVVNRRPDRGLSSSLRLGLETLQRVAPEAERALVLLGDQPRLSPDQLRIILQLVPDERRPIVVPRYAGGRAGNPVLLERPAWPLAADLRGDRGMSQLFEADAELLRHVDVPGTNPDVDTPADLAALQ
jgi:molybdenum cofactor cytidylyltransferase